MNNKTIVGTVFLFFLASNICFSQIPFSEVRMGCLDTFKLDATNIYTNEDEYHNLYTYMAPFEDCNHYVLPEVDFDRYRLIGIKVESGGCAMPAVKLQLEKEDGVCVFKVLVGDGGNCKALFLNSIWALVEKTECSKFSVQVTRQK